MITLGNIFREMNSWVPCQKYFDIADESGITTKNNTRFKKAVSAWQNGLYDEDPNAFVNELIQILNNKK